MPRIYVIDAMALAYRAYYAFIAGPLTRVAVRAAAAGTVHPVDLQIADQGRIRVAHGEGGEIQLRDPEGRMVSRVAVPSGAHVLVREGETVEVGGPLLAENSSAIFGMANMLIMLRREGVPDCWMLAWDGPGPTFRHERFPD